MKHDARQYYGWAELTPDGPVTAGSVGTWMLRYHVGEYGIDDGGTLKIAWRFASDWGKPQCDDAGDVNFYTVTHTGDGRVAHRWDPKGYIRPWQKCLVIDVAEWALARDDTITVVYGDTAGGSPGTVAQTFRERTFEFKVVVDAFGTGQFVEIETQPEIEIVPDVASRLVLVAPTKVACNEEFCLGVKLEDEWGNPAVGYRGQVAFDVPAGVSGLPETIAFDGSEGGARRLEGVRSGEAGILTFTARADGSPDELTGESNAIECVESHATRRPFWGDLHGQSEETVGTNSVEDYFCFARDIAFVDFAGHQGNDFQITDDFWERLGRCARQLHEPGRFVLFPGYEWSATTPAGGDRNVYYLEDGQPIYRTSHWQVPGQGHPETDRYPVGELFEQLRKGRPALVVPHIGGRPANLAFHDPEFEPVIEITSAWGQFEWLLEEAIERGYRVGFTGGSDDHKGRPGASYPGSSSFGVYGGMTCVLADELSREGVWEALHSRRCYATSGPRILLEVQAEDDAGDSHWIGEDFDSDQIHLRLHAVGTDEVEEVRLMRGLECVYRWPETVARDADRIRVVWSGARIKGRDRIATWDGELTLTPGTIRSAVGYAFDSANEGIVEQSDRRVAWRSVTSGDEDGVILDIEASPGSVLHFQSQIADFQLSLAELSDEPFVHAAGGVGLQVKIEYLPQGNGRQCSFEYREKLPPGDVTQPYYVRLTQSDGNRAWSSPFYVTRRTP
ncbi:MAG TPA: DUF3604 domain-containing protein [Candidatus Latescibacteria bacterium]|nr:DUF3604 domain-containing protein [Candidatus Latescibacterota bacterium]